MQSRPAPLVWSPSPQNHSETSDKNNKGNALLGMSLQRSRECIRQRVNTAACAMHGALSKILIVSTCVHTHIHIYIYMAYVFEISGSPVASVTKVFALSILGIFELFALSKPLLSIVQMIAEGNKRDAGMPAMPCKPTVGVGIIAGIIPLGSFLEKTLITPRPYAIYSGLRGLEGLGQLPSRLSCQKHGP